MGMRTGAAKQGFACSFWPWVRGMPGPLTFLLSFLLCLWDRGPVVCARQPPGTRGDGGESSEAMVRQTPTLPASVVLFPWPPYQPKLLQQLGTEQGASPQVISARASPWQAHQAVLVHSCFLSSPEDPPRSLCSPELSAGGWAGSDGGAACWRDVRCAISWD